MSPVKTGLRALAAAIAVGAVVSSVYTLGYVVGRRSGDAEWMRLATQAQDGWKQSIAEHRKSIDTTERCLAVLRRVVRNEP